VRLSVFNALGEEVDVLVDMLVPAGTHAVRWDSNRSGISRPSGVYTYRIHAVGSDGTEYYDVKKMLLVK
jgi:hypothetical protein